MTTSSRLTRAEGAHDDVAHPRRPGLTGLTTSIADPSDHSSEATTSGSRAGDPFNRREQGASGLVHRRARGGGRGEKYCFFIQFFLHFSIFQLLQCNLLEVPLEE